MNNLVTVNYLKEMKQKNEKIACLTAYDASFGKLLDVAGVDLTLVGDSLGMVIQGRRTTIPVTVEDVIYHCKAVKRGINRSMLVADMPFMSYATFDIAANNAARLLQEGGAQMVKLEGGGYVVEIIAKLTERQIPVCGHLGLTPQSIYKLGKYRLQGKTQEEADTIIVEAKALAEAGVDALVLECVPEWLAAKITQSIAVPVIGIGAGRKVDGQILVLYDILGLSGKHLPKFVKDFLCDAGNVADAIKNYVDAVREGRYPEKSHLWE